MEVRFDFSESVFVSFSASDSASFFVQENRNLFQNVISADSFRLERKDICAQGLEQEALSFRLVFVERAHSPCVRRPRLCVRESRDAPPRESFHFERN